LFFRDKSYIQEDFPKVLRLSGSRLIDIKIDNDMDKVVNEIKKLEEIMNVKYNMLIWGIGILVGLMSLLIGLKLFS
jgi:hypothetical protein